MESSIPLAVIRWFEAHDQHNPDMLIPTLTDDVTVRSLFRTAPAVGKAAARQHFEGVIAAFPDLLMPVSSESFDAASSVYLAELHFVGSFAGRLTVDCATHTGDGERFDVTGVVCQHLRDGLIATTATYFDRSDWLTQIGIAE